MEGGEEVAAGASTQVCTVPSRPYHHHHSPVLPTPTEGGVLELVG